MVMNDSAASVSRNVWLLGQVRGYATKKDLADAMGWEHSRLSRTLRGERRWTVDDLDDAVRALGLSTPGDLFRPLGELVGAAGSTRRDSVARTESMLTYLRADRPTLTSLPQVTASVLSFPQRKRDVVPMDAATRVVSSDAA